MAALSAQQIGPDGLAATYAAVGGSGDTVANDGKKFVHIKNGNAGSVTVTVPVVAPRASGPLFLTSIV